MITDCEQREISVCGKGVMKVWVVISPYLTPGGYLVKRTFLITLFLFFLGGSVLADDLTGTWYFQTTIDATEAGEGFKKQELEVEIEQNGEDVIFSFGSAVLKGKLRGNKLHVTGSYEEEGVIEKDLTFTVSGDTMSGGGNWTYVTDDYRTKGTEKLEGERAD